VDIEGMTDPAPRLLCGPTTRIAGIRVGQNAPGVVRLVVDLKQAASPRCSRSPRGRLPHRLVFDLYPEKAVDPLEALIAERLRDMGADTPPPASSPTGHALALPSTAELTDPLGDLIARTETERKPQPPPSPAHRRHRPITPGPHPIPTASSSLPSTPATAAKTPAPRPQRHARKDVVLKVAHLLRERINATTVGGNPMRAYLTRDGDFFVPLATRVEKPGACRPTCSSASTPMPSPPRCARCQRVCAEPGRGLQFGRPLAGQQGKPGRPGGRPERARQDRMCSAPCWT
jgi:N-acetylmuramoyl-L-alanine amidase